MLIDQTGMPSWRNSQGYEFKHESDLVLWKREKKNSVKSLCNNLANRSYGQYIWNIYGKEKSLQKLKFLCGSWKIMSYY